VRIRLPNGIRNTEVLPIGIRLGKRKRPWRKRTEEGEASTIPAVATIFCRFVREARLGRRRGRRRG
jgi:hypothetical protein